MNVLSNLLQFCFKKPNDSNAEIQDLPKRVWYKTKVLSKYLSNLPKYFLLSLAFHSPAGYAACWKPKKR